MSLCSTEHLSRPTHHFQLLALKVVRRLFPSKGPTCYHTFVVKICVRLFDVIGIDLFGKVTAAQLLKRYGFCGTQNFISEFKRIRYYIL
jgi:hypothetical protein